uniref:mRNA (guanine-N(7))-methyltransferase n=1 Tax=Ciona savignyi TaxID=51511 RepID=H2YL80_CIOSA
MNPSINISPNKRKRKSSQDFEESNVKRSSNAEKVAEHYNKRGNTSCAERRQSKIFYMRNFNNWTKSVLIKKYVDALNKRGVNHPVVLDLGCGKGGDILKWDKARPNHLICTDLAETSVSQCKDRYALLKKRHRNKQIFTTEFIVADSSKENLNEKVQDKQMKYDITSCQFVIHYSFESEEQATMMVHNACASLNKGRYFFGTTVNADKMIDLVGNTDDLSFGNTVFDVTFESKDLFPDFSCKYIFQLHDVVNCPEFLLKKETLVRYARNT